MLSMAAALAIVGLVMPIITVPTMTGTVIRVWSDQTEDTYRLNLSTNRPAGVRSGRAGRGLLRPAWTRWPSALQQETGIVLGGFAKLESVAVGFRWGLRFLSLMMLTLGLIVAAAVVARSQGLAGTAWGRLQLIQW